MELEFILNEDNSITCNVLKGSDDIIEATSNNSDDDEG